MYNNNSDNKFSFGLDEIMVRIMIDVTTIAILIVKIIHRQLDTAHKQSRDLDGLCSIKIIGKS